MLEKSTLFYLTLTHENSTRIINWEIQGVVSFEAVPQYIPGGIKENHEKYRSQDIQL
jgi:hypothetical protein